MEMDYQLVRQTASVEDFVNLRNNTRLSNRKKSSVEKGLPNTWYGVHIKDGDKTIAMGRIVGDGGIIFVVADIAVLPDYQRKGLGKVIMAELMAYYRANAPDDAYCCLMADGPAKHLYKKFGFEETAPASIGMAYWPNK
jgi:ribosomal protein S18 acetylase RimI-like enzyme